MAIDVSSIQAMTYPPGIAVPLHIHTRIYDRSLTYLFVRITSGDTDLVVGNGAGELKYFANNGDDTFSEQIGTSNPFDGIDAGSKGMPAFVDQDGDGDVTESARADSSYSSKKVQTTA